MKKHLLLSGISFIFCHNSFSCDPIQDGTNSSTSRIVEVTNVISAENSSLKKYLPKDLKCGTFEGFKTMNRISHDSRVYEFMGGSQIYGNKEPVLKTEAADVLPSTKLERPLPLDKAFVDLKDQSLILTFKYQDASVFYSGYSYTVNVQTKLEAGDLENAQVESLVNQFIPTAAKRGDFNGLKQGTQCLVENKPYMFVSGKFIYKAHEEVTSSPEAVLPDNLWGNSWRPNHQLKNFSLDLTNAKVQLTYQYQPSVWYRGDATHFAFIVETPLDNETVVALQPHVPSIKMQQLHTDLLNAYNKDLLAADEYLSYAMQISALSQVTNFENQFNELKQEIDRGLSPMSLYSKSRIKGNVLLECEKNKTLDSKKDSIDKFIPGFSLKD